MDKLKEMLRTINFGTDSKKLEIEAPSIEKAIAEACRRLRSGIDDLEYEIIQYGNKGIAGVGSRNYRIIAYKRAKISVEKELHEEELADINTETEKMEEIVNPDGTFAIIKSRQGVLLKVTAPKSPRGKAVKLKEVTAMLEVKGIDNFDEKMVKTTVTEAGGLYVTVAPYDGLEELSAKAQVHIGMNEMSATITLFPAKPRGFEFIPDELMSVIQDTGVTHGILEDMIVRVADEKLEYKEIVIAQGKQADNGKDAEIKYYFDPNAEMTIFKNVAEDKFDFKNIIKNIQNVLKGDLLCERIPPTQGEDGYTVVGKVLPCKQGVDRKILNGENTELSADGNFLRATVDGHVVRKAGKIGVEPVKHIQGDVDIKVGNITFVGSVVVHGSVMDGFSIKAKGNIEVRGTVGKCEIISDNDIFIGNGVTGRAEGLIAAEGSVFAKFIENANVQAGRSIIVDDHITHSKVDANESIICFGKRAQIGGGVIRAGREVNSRNLGTLSYAETIVEVGILPKLRIEFQELQMEFKKLTEGIDDVKRDITTLNNYKKMRQNWNPDKEAMLKEKSEMLPQYEETLQNVSARLEELKTEINSMDLKGKVSVKSVVYVGVKIYIKDVFFDVTNEMRTITFAAQDNQLKSGPYEPPSVDSRMFDQRILSIRNKLS